MEKKEDAVESPAPLVSVVIPAYKVAPYIIETLNSVFSQTLTEFEVIVVNDGSPDMEQLERVIAPYRERIRYLRQDNCGASAARNRGVLAAHGEFVAFLDGDDIWMPNYLEKQLEFLRKGDYDLAYTDARLFGDPAMAGKTYMQTAPSRGPVTFVSLVRNKCNVITSGVVARRLALIKAGLFDERLRNAQDFELWARLARGGARLGYQRKVLLRYRCRADSLSGSVMNRLAREMLVYRHIEDNYDLTSAEHAELSRVMKLQEAAVELAKGKLHLLSGRCDEARTSFKRACRVLGGWKLPAAIFMVRVAPGLLRRYVARRLSGYSNLALEDSSTQTTWAILHSYQDHVSVDECWRKFLTRADFAAHYVSPEYFREPFVRDKRPFVVLAWQGERVVAALSGIHEEQQLICGLRSRPQICFDKTVDPAAASDALVAGLFNEAESEKLITFYSWAPLDNLSKYGYRCKQEEGVVMLDLTKGPDELFKQFASTRRTDIRNAIKRGLEIVIAGTRKEFRAYYEIYADWCRRKKIAPSSFEVIEEALSLPNRRLFLARYEGEPIAGTIIRLYPGAMIEYAANSSLVEYLNFKPNDLLQWRIVEWACGQGYKRYSLGGAHLFVRRMGGSIVPVYRYRFDRTWLHRYELKEALEKSGRNIFNALPGSLKTLARRAVKGH